MMRKIRIAQIQMPVFADKKDTVEYIEKAVKRASENADFVTLPEMFCCPYSIDNFADYAEKDGGEMWKVCSELAKEQGIYLPPAQCRKQTKMKIYIIRPMCLTGMENV